MRYDYVNPKRKIRKHLQKRQTNFAGLYVLFVVAILAIGVIGMVLRSDWQSLASELSDENNYNESFLAEIEAAKIEENNLPSTIDLEIANTLFPRTTKESLLREMIDKEGIDLTVQEEKYFETH